jgi:hypothetical protein
MSSPTGIVACVELNRSRVYLHLLDGVSEFAIRFREPIQGEIPDRREDEYVHVPKRVLTDVMSDTCSTFLLSSLLPSMPAFTAT